ncbi:MAG: flavin monoamine oxidase family protein, partial [Aggregatilineales bacterium]
DGRWLTMADARAISPDFDLTRSWEIDDIPVKPGDESFEDYLRRINFTDEQLQYVRRSFANAEGDDMRFLSAESIISAFNDFEHEPGAGDFRILDGYDAIYTHLATDLDIRLNCKITSIEWGENGVTITAADGTVFTGDTAIITLPVGVLKANHVTFTPELPAIKEEALSGMAMGPIIKLVYEFAAPLMDRKIGAIYSKHNPPMWWSPSLGRDENTIVWTAFITGDYAREMDALDEAAALEKGLETLRTELNQPDLNYKQARWINWIRDEFALGGYSHCRVGHADVREKLATPTPPLYWAGEATAPHVMMATIHGAYFTGERAAHEILNQGDADDT